MPLHLELDFDRGVPVYRQIHEAVVAARSTAQLEGHEQLPTIHELARTLGVNPNTVARAYRDLERDGYIVAQRGRGTFATPKLPVPMADRDAVLHEIFTSALLAGARHNLTAKDIVRYFRKTCHDR